MIRISNKTFPPLPVSEVLPSLLDCLRVKNSAVLVAPPGAGKTTRVPLALLDEEWTAGKRIIMLEPRRIAARAAAGYMAGLLGEKAGETVGYRVRLDTKISNKTRIEVVTGGVLARMILNDPELEDIAAIIFDEFHERSMDGDLALALALDIQSALRPDLRILPMSATLDGAAVANLLEGAETFISEGSNFPVKILYENRKPDERIEEAMVRTVLQTLKKEEGSILCFLPGQAEIMRCEKQLQGKLPGNVDVTPLYGALPSREQQAAIRPASPDRRKIVLATSIAETSMTIDGVRVVIDSGLARVPRHEPDTGLTRLETIRASKASITQRAGRAGRTGPGVVKRLWHEGQTASLPDYERPEILEADLSGLVLDLAQWGVHDPQALKWLDRPPGPAWNEAVSLLSSLGALGPEGRLTEHGKRMRSLALAPRLSMMVLKAIDTGQARDAALLALLVSERGMGGKGDDLAGRLEKVKRDKNPHAKKARQMADRIASSVSAQSDEMHKAAGAMLTAGALLSFAYPDRIARNTGNNDNGESVFHLVNGRRALLDGLSVLARANYITIAEIQGKARDARILGAAEILRSEIEQLHAERISNERIISYKPETKQFRALKTVSLGEMRLAETPTALTPDDDIATAMMNAIKASGLSLLDFSGAALELKNRLAFLHHHRPEIFPDVSDAALTDTVEDWLLPFIGNAKGFADITGRTLVNALENLAGHKNTGLIDRLAPRHFTVPSGSSIPIRYENGKAILAVRVQEVFGLKKHPTIMEGHTPLQLELLSPAHRPVQTTLDLAGFWTGSWQDVKKEMKGRYPKHYWPDDPANAMATNRAKPRGKNNA